MFPSAHLGELVDVHTFFPPIDLQGASGAHIDGDWLAVHKGHRFSILFSKGAGTAGQDPTLTVQQATTSSGTSAKALNFTEIWVKQPTGASDLTAVTGWTLVTQSAANTYTEATSAETAAMWRIEFSSSDLDGDGGFDFVNATVADVGGNAQIGSCHLLIWPRYGPTRISQHLTLVS